MTDDSLRKAWRWAFKKQSILLRLISTLSHSPSSKLSNTNSLKIMVLQLQNGMIVPANPTSVTARIKSIRIAEWDS